MLNSEKLYKKLTELPELKGIPTMHIVMVAVALLKIIEEDNVFIGAWDD